MPDKPRLMIVDDDAEIRETLRDYFELQDFEVHEAADGDSLRAAVAEGRFDIVLLDLRLPGEDGLSLCRFLRQDAHTGIIMLTGESDPVDRIVGLEMGADDYVAKPFELRELLARVKSVLRRVTATGGRAPSDATPAARADAEILRFGPFEIDPASRILRGGDGEVLPLTAMEFDLLRTFAERPNQVLTRDQLLDQAHDRDWEPFDRSIDVRITRIRRKIEDDPARPRYIRTVRGVGYIFKPDGV